MAEPRGAADGGPRRVDVTFSPPTPNGDLHLGHLSGPVLASDVCARSQKILGNDVAFASSTDDNQTYVVTTARRLGTTPEALIRQALGSVRGTLGAAAVGVDLFERPDERYETFVRTFFTTLWEAGAFDRREVELPYDAESGQYRAEAFVTGRCPSCLAHARAGVCEACGLYNLPGALLPVEDGGPALPREPVPIWVLDLERYRSMITGFYASPEGAVQRPDLRGVVAETLAGRLPAIPVTYPGDWGISVDWDGPDAPPQTVNAWPEIYVGHLYWLRRARETRDAIAGRESRAGACDELVQFIGIDNGFYNAFVYLALSLLAVEHGLPVERPATRTITNQYFLLEGRKFSTSKGDVVWAGDYLAGAGRDRARFVLALTSPELQQSEFTEQVAAATLKTRFDEPLAVIDAALNERLAGRGIDAPPSPWWRSALEASVRRFEGAYALDTFSIRRAAEALALHLEVLALRGARLRTDDPSEVSGALMFLWALRVLAWPVTPDLAAGVAAAFETTTADSLAGAPPPEPPPEPPPLLEDVAEPPSGHFRGISLARR
ncbi:class I tRNA ligase family protein [Actinomadura litoris]|uniref:class I tRNA ligase family protein n=1 Tax=Actinomadura litoris TaxID=2678616 RepID=UPI001FA78D0D|nr:class I tRNA ligase family protein [Actinomadura litoris]